MDEPIRDDERMIWWPESTRSPEGFRKVIVVENRPGYMLYGRVSNDPGEQPPECYLAETYNEAKTMAIAQNEREFGYDAETQHEIIASSFRAQNLRATYQADGERVLVWKGNNVVLDLDFVQAEELWEQMGTVLGREWINEDEVEEQ